MRRRPLLTATFVALLAVGGSVVTQSNRGPVLAADPIAQAKAQRDALHARLDQQRARLDQLRARSEDLADNLDLAKAALREVTAEYDRVRGLLAEVREQVADIRARVAELRSEIDALDRELWGVAREIAAQTDELHAREALLEDHMRSAYEQSQTSLLEIMLSADSLDVATNQVGYLLTISDQDRALADEIRVLRQELELKEDSLREGRQVLREARMLASEEQAKLEKHRAQLAELRARTAELKAAAEQKRREQAAALTAALKAKGDLKEEIARSERAFAAANRLVTQLVAEQAALEEARRRAAEQARYTRPPVSARGFQWPEASFHVTQEWGPTDFVLEPPYTYQGTYYPHFHGGIDIANGCGTPIMAAGTGVVVASGQPLWPFDSGYGVVIDHGGGVQTWYWHITTQVVVSAGQPVTIGQVIGYEGSTGNSTGCHLHFAVNDQGVWENPRWYLP